MNVLALGINLWQHNSELAAYRSARGHVVRTLGVEGSTDCDYRFAPFETASELIARLAKEFPVDLLLCGCPELYPPPLEIEHAPVRTAAVISDWNLYQPQLEHSLARFDVVLSDRRGNQDLALAGVTPIYWGPIYSHRPAIHRNLGTPRDIAIGYLGNMNPAAHPRRHRLLDRIRTLGHRYPIEISGEHPPEQYAQLLNRTRIAFNCSIRGEMNLRCFEAPACGALLFIEHDNLEAPAYFTHGESAVFYDDDNLLELLEHYLTHENERARIAAAGEATVREMAAMNRLDAMLDFIAVAPGTGRPWHTFDAATRARGEAMCYSSALPPAQHAVAKAKLDDWLDACPSDAAALMAQGCFAFDAAAWSAREERRQWIARALQCFELAAMHSPGDAGPWHNMACLMEALDQTARAGALRDEATVRRSTRLAAFVLGRRTDPRWVDIRWRLAMGEEDIPLYP